MINVSVYLNLDFPVDVYELNTLEEAIAIKQELSVRGYYVNITPMPALPSFLGALVPQFFI